MLEAARLLSRAWFPGRRYASRADDLILIGALFIGTAEGRPMNASKLSDYAGLPRSTVIRKLAAMERRGVVVKVGGGFALSANAMNSVAAVEAAQAVAKVLSKLGR